MNGHGITGRRRNLSPPHPEEPTEAGAKAGVSKDGAARWFETRCSAALLTIRQVKPETHSPPSLPGLTGQFITRRGTGSLT
jgi:hypothetical protein